MLLTELFPYADVVYNIFMVLYILTIVATISVIVGENRNPVKSLAWATLLVLLPVAGIVLYLFFGRNLKNHPLLSRKKRRKLNKRKPNETTHLESLSDENRHQIHLADTLVQSRYYEGNNVEVFTQGKDKFDALMKDIAQAQTYIHIQYYIIENDNLGRQLADLLITKAQQGVKVRVIYDHVGSYTINSALFKRLRRGGVEAHPFLKVTFTTFAARLNWRNHRKVVVIDGQVGYIGGMNIADRYVTGNKGKKPWRDTHMRITGPAVKGLHNSFAIDWNFMNHKLLKMPETFTPAPTGNMGVQIVPSGPTDTWNGNSFVVLRAISMAKKSLFIQTPYFLPSDSLLKALQAAALSGVDVRVMIPRRTDSVLLRYASGSYIKESLLAGIKIYLYDDAMMHAKVLIVDDDFVTAGSSNFDFRSFEHNFECNALIYSTAFNHTMKEIFKDDQSRSTRLILSHWKRRPITTKALESLARLFAPIL